ncbi:MAG: PQQ-binding-like beta-propeller repeat protein [Streptomyces sp.]|uniref:protein kinase domain-containing protein n=1 Tax=Streptomyces sp. TaxID=1931 RepID=UPI0025F15E59|nr:PQQ-binding-like beta-propeller repeat protein [Streptomyces sp.]MBW8799745.1 PQQ-binding-like beta-propeller repeat protein [Streptomyces sp.]
MPLHKDDPRSLGGYRLVDRLGAGGMGIVYRGRSRSGREVAVKVVHAQYAEDPVFRARFRQEIEAARRVSGAFTAPVLDADPDARAPWMATQYVPGQSLAARIRAHGALRVAELRPLALGLVEALRDIHRAGMVHRDLKPANVLMAGDGPRVIDFGISRAAENHNTLTETGQMVGTPPFMSPEQFTDARTVGPASDVFSLGALLVYCVTGRGPFDADSPYLTGYRVVHNEPVLDGVTGPLRAVLERCLAKDPADRPGLDELSREFAAALPEPDPGDPETMSLWLPSARSLDPGTVPADATPGPGAGPDRATGTGSGRRRIGSLVRDRVRGRRALWAAVGTVGALTLGLQWYLPVGPGFADGPRTASSSSASRWAAVPAGWQPWQTTVYKPADQGEVKALGTPAEGQSDCLSQGDGVYCGGHGVLPVRLDGRTGRTLWRAALAAPGDDASRYDSWVLGVHDGTVLVRETITETGAETNPTFVVALDATSGSQLWIRKVNDENVDLIMAGDLVLTAERDGRTVTARSPRTGEARWAMTLPARSYCTFLPAKTDLYAQCFPTEQDAEYSSLLRLDHADGTVLARRQVPFESGFLGIVDGRPAMVLADEESGSTSLQDSRFAKILLTDPTTGGRTTTKLAKTYEGSVTLAADTLWITGANGEVAAVSPLTGKELWHTRTSVENSGSPTYDSRTHTLYLASPSGRVAALDTRKGTLLWQTSPRVGTASTGDASDPKALLDGGAVTVMTPDGTLFSLDPAHPERRSGSG